MANTVKQLIEGFENKRVVVIGDVIIDTYVYGTATGLSAETPTIVAKEETVKQTVGGAFMVARNLLELGAKVDFFTVVGNDWVEQYIHDDRLHRYVYRDEERRTTQKRRFWIDNYKLFQIDTLDQPRLPFHLGAFYEKLLEKIEDASVVILSDYRHGLFEKTMVAHILDMCNDAEVPVYVDSQISRKTYSESNYEWYMGADLFCMNLREAQFTSPGFEISVGNPVGEQSLRGCFEQLDQKLHTAHIVVKLGDEGSVYYKTEDMLLASAKALKVEAVDTCGAGDSFLAALALCDIEEHPQESLQIANTWAGLSCSIHGIEPPKKDQLLNQFLSEVFSK